MNTFRHIALPVLTMTALAACGGDTSKDSADKYEGVWRSVCAPFITNGQTYYTYRVRTLTKLSADELAGTNIAESAYSDAICTQRSDVQALSRNPSKIRIVSRATFLGQTVDTIAETDLVENITSAGYGTANSKQMFLVYELDGKKPIGWSENSPYTKQ
jgi:hypothetical protein